MLPEEAVKVAISRCNMLEFLNVLSCPKVSVITVTNSSWLVEYCIHVNQVQNHSTFIRSF